MFDRMSWRAVHALAVMAGLVTPAGAAEQPKARTESSSSASSKTKQKSKHASESKTKPKPKPKRASKTKPKSSKLASKRPKKSKAKQQVVTRVPSKRTLRNTSNMPRGYAWPPNRQMRASEKACHARLDEIGVAWKPATTEGRIAAPMLVDDGPEGMSLGGIRYTSAYRKGPHKLDCHLALALTTFGKDLHAAGVREVKFGSIFRWTNVRVNGETRPFLSRHALGIAMDIVSFFDASGREAHVERDYPAGDPLLLAVEEAVNASGMFRILLTPKNDPASHADHFHIEVAVD
jgi:hypothetical protein